MRAMSSVAMGLVTVLFVMNPLFFPSALAADADTPKIILVTSPLIPWIGTRDRALPDSLETMRQGKTDLDQFYDLTKALALGDEDTAIKLQADAEYQIYKAPFDGKDYLVALDESGAGLGPALVINPSAERDLILEAPHGSFELGSGEQAALLLTRLGARAALIGGAHRCASRTHLTCDGKTGVCGSLQSYLDSDVAHAPYSRFQAAHRALVDAFPKAVTISLHGKQVDKSGSKPEIVMSNGIRAKDPKKETAATQLRLALSNYFQRPGSIISCNLPADDQFQYRELCGYDNIQGRYVNKSSDPCTEGVTVGTGLFIHFEQDWPMLIPFHSDWPTNDENTYLNALAEALTKVDRIRPVEPGQ